jgi:hypothetical protein
MIELHCLIMWATMAEGRFGLTSQAAESGFVIDGNCFVGTCGRSMIARRHVSLYGKSPIRIEERSAQSVTSINAPICGLSLVSVNPLVNSTPAFNPVRQMRWQLNHALPSSVRSKTKSFGRS